VLGVMVIMMEKPLGRGNISLDKGVFRPRAHYG